jgi:hypothetical protein
MGWFACVFLAAEFLVVFAINEFAVGGSGITSPEAFGSPGAAPGWSAVAFA